MLRRFLEKSGPCKIRAMMGPLPLGWELRVKLQKGGHLGYIWGPLIRAHLIPLTKVGESLNLGGGRLTVASDWVHVCVCACVQGGVR